MGFEPGTFRLQNERANHSVLISIKHLKNKRVLPECTIKPYMYHVVDEVKCFEVYYILLTLYSQQTSFKISQASKR